MTPASKAFCLGALVAINGLLATSLVYTWLSIYEQYSYPIDFFMPVQRTQTRATLTLCTSVMTVPAGFALYWRSARDLASFGRIATLVVTSVAAFIVVAFAAWRYLR